MDLGDKLIDAVRAQERDKMRLERRLGRKSWHLRGARKAIEALREQNASLGLEKALSVEPAGPASHDIVPTGEGGPSKADVVETLRGVICEKDVVIAELKGTVATLKERVQRLAEEGRKQANGGLSTEKAKCYDSAVSAVREGHAALTEMGAPDDAEPLVERMAWVRGQLLSVRSAFDEADTKLRERNEELAAVREQRGRLIEDNVALADERDANRREKHEVEEELADCQNAMDAALAEAGAPQAIGGLLARVQHLGKQPDISEAVSSVLAEVRQENKTLRDELAAVREQRDGLLADNTALAGRVSELCETRDAVIEESVARGEQIERLEAELTKLRRTRGEGRCNGAHVYRTDGGVTAELDAARDARDDAEGRRKAAEAERDEALAAQRTAQTERVQYRMYAIHVIQHGGSELHSAACEAAGLPKGWWHEEGAGPPQQAHDAPVAAGEGD